MGRLPAPCHHTGDGVSKPHPSQADPSGVDWRISSYSGGSGNCVQVAKKDGFILVGDSKASERPPHVFTLAEWEAFVLGPRTGSSMLFDH